MEIGTFRGLVTLLAMAAFIGVVWWAWTGRRRKPFDQAAHMPLEEDSDTNEDK